MLLIEFKQGNETYTVSEEGRISKRVVTTSSLSESTIHWLDLMPNVQEGILAIARAKGDEYFQKVNKAIQTRMVLDIIYPVKGEVTPGRKVESVQQSYKVTRL